jgi:membrane protease YdiL (CAAX protease family)
VSGESGAAPIHGPRVPPWLLVALASVVALAVWWLLIDAETRQPPPQGALTVRDLEDRVRRDPDGFRAMLALKFGPALAGFVVLVVAVVLRRSRNAAIRAGHLPPPPLRPPPAPILGPLQAFLVVVAYFATVTAFAAGLAWLRRRGGPASPFSGREMDIALAAIAGVPFAILVLWLRRARARSLSIGARLRAAFLVYLAGSAVTLVLTVVGALVLQSITGRDPAVQKLVEEGVETPRAAFLWALVVYGVLGAPLVEEALFRGLLYPAIRHKSGATIAAFSTAILFAAVHGEAVAYLPLLGLALLLAGLFEATDSLLACTLVHALNNLTSLVPILLMRGS